MRKAITTYLALLGLLLAASGPVFGQGTGTQIQQLIDNLRRELEQTDQVITRAREAVRASSSAKAQFALESAIKLQERAWQRFRVRTAMSLREAAILTRQAREKAKYALANGLFSQQNEDVVLRRLEKVSDLLDRARESIGAAADRSLRAIFDSAEDNLRRAREFYREGHYRPALKLCNQAENTLRKIINAAVRRQHGVASFERHADNVRDLIESARQKLSECQSETGMKSLEQSEHLYRLACELSSQKNHRAAMRTLQNARKMAVKAVRECDGLRGLAERYERIKHDADRIAENVPPDDDQARRLLNQVYEQLELAHDFVAEEHSEAAVAALKAAQLTLNQVKRLLGGAVY